MLTKRPSTFDSHESERIRALQGAPLASFGRRATAFALDLLLVLAGYIAFGLPAALRARALDPSRRLTIPFDPFHGFWGLVAVVLYFGVLTYLGHGFTPGKRLVGIRVVSTAHDHLSVWQCIERALGYGASALEGGFGFFQYFIHPNRRTVHDRIAETVVIRAGVTGRPSDRTS